MLKLAARLLTAAALSVSSVSIAAQAQALDRVVACEDGLTVADTETGLLWERKTGTVGKQIAFPQFTASLESETFG